MTLNVATLDRLADEVVVLLVLLESEPTKLLSVHPDAIIQCARVHDVLRKVGVRVQRNPAMLLEARDISLAERRRILDEDTATEQEKRRRAALSLAQRFRVNGGDAEDDD